MNCRTNKKVSSAGHLDSYTHNSITMKLDHRRIPISFALPPRNTNLEALLAVIFMPHISARNEPQV